jgi:PAS domain S-box-containing protein
MEAIAKNRRKAPSRQKKDRVVRNELGEKYRVMVENAAQGIIVLQDGRLQYANARARNFFEKPIEGLTPEALVNMVHPDDRSMLLDRHAQRLRGVEVPAVYPFRMVAADGQVRWVEASVSMMEWEGRSAVLVLAEDITEQKKMEAALAESERTIRALLDASPALEFLVGPDGKILVCNQAFERFFGSDGKPLTGRNIQDLLSPEENQVNKGKALEVFSTGKPVFFEDYQRGLWLEKSFTPILDEEGRVAKIACYGMDISGKKRAAEALKENELRYRLLAENATDVIWTTDLNLRLTYVSPGVTRLRGYTPEEVMAEPLEKAFSPESRALLQKVYAEELAEEQKDTKDLSRTRTMELEHRCKDGSTVWAESKISAIRDAEGKIVQIIGVTRDITERKKAEEAARRWAEENALMAEISRIISSSLNTEEVYGRFAEEVRKLMEFENITIGMINAEERSLAISHVSGTPVPGREVGTLLPLDGTAAEEIYKTQSSLFIHKENLEEAFRKFPQLNAAIEAGRLSMIMVPLIREDRVFGILNILSSRPDAYTRAHVEIAEKVATRIAGAVANARLFRELQRTVEALEESELRNRSLVQAAGISGLGIVVLKGDKRGKVICAFANEEAEKITGYTAEELSRIPFPEIIHPAHRELALSGYWTRMAGDQKPVLYQLVVGHKQGHTVLIEVSVIRTVFRGEESMIGIFRDISERKQAEKELADHRAHLEEMVEERTARIHEMEQQRTEIEKMAATGVLAARIAHEINNPLAGIKGSFTLIQDTIPPDHPYHHYIGRIHGEINRIARIVRQMFELYRSPEEDQEDWEMEQMIQDIVALLNDEARERKVSFHLPVLPLKVGIPAGPVRQVLFNVIKNAVEASPVEGRVQVSVEGGEKGITIQVMDEGPGISEKNRPHVFKPFFSTKKATQKGLGLGLSISKEIVESLGGSIWVQNLHERGCLCQIDLPKRKPMKENTHV